MPSTHILTAAQAKNMFRLPYLSARTGSMSELIAKPAKNSIPNNEMVKPPAHSKSYFRIQLFKLNSLESSRYQ